MLDREFIEFLLQPPGRGSEIEAVVLVTILALVCVFAAIMRRHRKPWLVGLASVLSIALASAGWMQMFDNRRDRYACYLTEPEDIIARSDRACRWWAGTQAQQAVASTPMAQLGDYSHPRIFIWRLETRSGSDLICAANISHYCDFLVGPNLADEGDLLDSNRRLYTVRGFMRRSADDLVYRGE